MMRNYLLKISVIIISLFGFAVIVPVTTYAECDASTPAGAIACGTDNSAGVPTSATPVSDLNTTIANVINLLSIVVGILAVIMIIVGGFRYVTSGGKDESVKGAKNTILYAIIGLVIVALAQLIVHFVLDKTSNATATVTNSSNSQVPTTGVQTIH